jgi:hypothetical protein
MAERKTISKKLRFEIFKRDSFKCQYCGSSAPDVVLEVDHINPVSKGGANNILNYVTSCYDCNRGKSNRLLSDTSEVKKQQLQLELLNEKRQQLKLMMQWREELISLDDELVLMYEKLLSKLTNRTLNEVGKSSALKLIKKFGISECMDALQIACSKYLKLDKNNKYTDESVEYALSKIGGILYLKSQPESVKVSSYIKGILRNKFNYFDDRKASILLNEYFQYFEDYNECIEYAKYCKNWSQWYNGMKEFMDKYSKSENNFDDF